MIKFFTHVFHIIFSQFKFSFPQLALKMYESCLCQFYPTFKENASNSRVVVILHAKICARVILVSLNNGYSSVVCGEIIFISYRVNILDMTLSIFNSGRVMLGNVLSFNKKDQSDILKTLFLNFSI
jgi:hypothetical protein